MTAPGARRVSVELKPDTLIYTVEGNRVGRCRNCQSTDWVTNWEREGGCGHCGYNGPPTVVLQDLPCVTYFYDDETTDAPNRPSHEVFVFANETDRDVWVDTMIDAYPDSPARYVLNETSRADALLALARQAIVERDEAEGQEPLGAAGCM